MVGESARKGEAAEERVGRRLRAQAEQDEPGAGGRGGEVVAGGVRGGEGRRKGDEGGARRERDASGWVAG